MDDKKDLGFVLRGYPVKYRINKESLNLEIFYKLGLTFEDFEYIRDLLIIREDIKEIDNYYFNIDAT